MTDPAELRVRADLAEPAFLAGIHAGRWRVIGLAFPRLDFAITATDPDGQTVEYCFYADLSGFPAVAPKVRIWDMVANVALPRERRPQGGSRVMITFQCWGDDTVYRPWDRNTGPHGDNAINKPHLAWRPDRKLTFIFEDLHGILNSNARAHRLRQAA